MNNSPDFLFKQLDNIKKSIEDTWEEEPTSSPQEVQWDDVPTVSVEPDNIDISPDEIRPVSRSIPAVPSTPKDIVPSKPIREKPNQTKAFNYWLELHQEENKLSGKDIDQQVAESVGITYNTLKEWKTKLNWVSRRIEADTDNQKEKILVLISGHEQIEAESIAIIHKYLNQLEVSKYPIDRPTIKLMQELIEFSRRNLDSFQTRVFERKIGSITAGVSLTIRKD